MVCFSPLPLSPLRSSLTESNPVCNLPSIKHISPKASVLLIGCTLALSGTYNFLAVGDWGGIGVNPYTAPGEKLAAIGMGDIAAQFNAQFVLGLGDNFYDAGEERRGGRVSLKVCHVVKRNGQEEWYFLAPLLSIYNISHAPFGGTILGAQAFRATKQAFASK